MVIYPEEIYPCMLEKMLSKYEVDVCRHCRQNPCEYDDMKLCAETYHTKSESFELSKPRWYEK